MNIEGRELRDKLVAANEQAILDKLKAKGLSPLKLKKIDDTDRPAVDAEFEIFQFLLSFILGSNQA